MREGRIAEIGTPHELFLSPKTAFTARFLGAGTVLEAETIAEAEGSITVRSAVGVTAIKTRESPARSGSRRKCLILLPKDALRIVGADSGLALCRARVESSAFTGERETVSVELADGTAIKVESAPRGDTPKVDSTVGIVVDETLLSFLDGEGA